MCEHVHLPMQIGLDAHAQAHAAPLHARGVPRVRRAAARGDSRPRAHDRHHRRLSGRDGRRLRGDAERRARDRLRRRVHVQVLAARRHAGDADAGGADRARRGGERAARSVWSTRSGRGARERNLGLLGKRHEVLVEKEARRGEAMLHDAHARLQDGARSGRRVACSASYLTVELTGTTGSTFTGAIVASASRCRWPASLRPAAFRAGRFRKR